MSIGSALRRLGAFILAGGVAAAAGATVQRTFVASTGNDANPCSLTLPCRGFTAAVTKTSDKGEVIVLDSAGYGPLTITQSVSITAPAGIYAGVSVFTGNGIDINGAGITVRLRGLTVNGQAVGTTGVFLRAGGKLAIEDCEFNGLSQGVEVIPAGAASTIVDSHFQDNSFGLVAVAGNVTVERSTFQRNNIGVAANDGRLTVVDCLIADSTNTGASVGATAGNGMQAYFARSTFTGNATTFSVGAFALTSVSNASLVSDGNVIAYTNVVYDFEQAGGVEAIFTRGNNSVGYYGQLNPKSGTVITLGPI